MDRSKWEYKKLGDICILLNGFAFKSEKYVDNGIRVMRITNVQKGEIVDDDPKFYPMSSQSEIQRYMLKENDLLVSLTGNVGRVGLLQRELLPAALNQRVACLRLKGDSTDLRYLFHLMNSDLFENECIVNSQGIAQKNMSTKWLSDYKLPVPPKEDQQRIVAELDCLNEMIAVKQEQLKEFDKLAQSIFYDMFGDPVENEKEWRLYSLSSICDVRDGTHDSPQYVEEGYPLITSKNVIGGGISFDNVKYISKADLDSINARSRVDDGDIILPMIGTIGNPVIVHKDREFAIKNVALIKFASSTNVLNLYIQRLLDCESYSNYIMGLNRGGTQKFIALKTIRNLPIPLPPLALQQQFAEKISAIEAQKELVKQSIAETQALLDYTMDKYFG